MSRRKPLLDELGVIHDALAKMHDSRLKMEFMEALGVRQPIYRADINKSSGWRIHVQYVNGNIVLKDVIEGKHHDSVLKVISAKKGRYE